MKLHRLAPALLALGVVWAAADDVEAAPRRGGSGIHQGGFIYGSPGVIVIPVDEDDFFDLDPTWQWSFGGGYLWTPGRYFKASLGGAFEHTILNFDDIDDDAVNGHLLRFMAESRIGAGTPTVWGYGLVGVGLAIGAYEYDFGPFNDENEADPGAAIQLGGGVQGAVWRSLFLGGELDFDLHFMDGDDGPGDDDYSIHNLGIKFIIGWYF